MVFAIDMVRQAYAGVQLIGQAILVVETLAAIVGALLDAASLSTNPCGANRIVARGDASDRPIGQFWRF